MLQNTGFLSLTVSNGRVGLASWGNSLTCWVMVLTRYSVAILYDILKCGHVIHFEMWSNILLTVFDVCVRVCACVHA